MSTKRKPPPLVVTLQFEGDEAKLIANARKIREEEARRLGVEGSEPKTLRDWCRRAVLSSAGRVIANRSMEDAGLLPRTQVLAQRTVEIRSEPSDAQLAEAADAVARQAQEPPANGNPGPEPWTADDEAELERRAREEAATLARRKLADEKKARKLANLRALAEAKKEMDKFLRKHGGGK